MQDGSHTAVPVLEARCGWITHHTPLYHIQGPYKQKYKTSAQHALQRAEVMPAVSPPSSSRGPHTRRARPWKKPESKNCS